MDELRAALLLVLHVAVALATAGHALLHKRDPRSAWAWITVLWLVPLACAVLYVLFGVNRIERRARKELGGTPPRKASAAEPLPEVPGIPAEVTELVRIGRTMAGEPLAPGNRVQPLYNGAQAYPDMLAAIAAARRTVWLESYIFEDGEAARAFADALAAAEARGVQVRVLLDGVGGLAWRRRGSRRLRERGVRLARFLPLRLWPPMLHVNLRNHRKLLVVDGAQAWVGGMNISDDRLPGGKTEMRTDLHFRLEGPIVAQLEAVFCEDWRFASGESLALSPPAAPAGKVYCRALTDGPNESVRRFQMLLMGALANAHERISILTPYLIPTHELSAALESAALRGVEVCIVVPQRSDQWWVDFATRRWLAELAGGAVRLYYRPAPFAHTKLFLMDDYYAIFGSANLDTRSLRLNFELVVEAYDTTLAAGLRAHFDQVRGSSREVTAQDLAARSQAARLADAVFWLFSPYL